MITGIHLNHLPFWLGGSLFERLPVWVTNGLGVNFYFGGTSLLIVVGVAMDTVYADRGAAYHAPLRWIYAAQRTHSRGGGTGHEEAKFQGFRVSRFPSVTVLVRTLKLCNFETWRR